ncbi:MAG TPA: hypothetical protein PKD45_13135 [Flavobacteriales bacterium]|nr:hypothetical protein [Flavobacteriales bacterium]
MEEAGHGGTHELALKFYIRRIKTLHAMAGHEQEGHFPDEAEQNEIGGPVTLAIMILAMVVLILWAAC